MRQLTGQEQYELQSLLAELVKINSAQSSTEPPEQARTEEQIANYLTNFLQKLGMEIRRQEVYPGRPNLIAHWPEQKGETSLMLEAHMDTVPIKDMTIDPFAAEIREGRMYGRGSCDTKGSMTAFLTALRLAKEDKQLPADKLYFVATASEETGCTGASTLMKHGFRTDAAIVGEPTACKLVTAHKGPLWLKMETFGQPCHASVPEQGSNAIELMSRAVQVVHGPWTEYLRQRSHPLLGRSTCQVTLIEGGSEINILPAHCTAKIDSRLISGPPNEKLVAKLEGMLEEALGDRDCFRVELKQQHNWLDCPPQAPVAKKMLDLCNRFNGQEHPEGVDYFADTGPFSAAGITSVLFGPGDIRQAHTADEYVELDQVSQATEIMLGLLTEHAGKSIVSE